MPHTFVHDIMLHGRRWQHPLFFLFFLHLSSAQLALISTPCLLSCFIEVCPSLAARCICNATPRIAVSGRFLGCTDNGEALQKLLDECRFAFRIFPTEITTTGIARGSSAPVQSDDPPTFTSTLVSIYSTVIIIATQKTTSRILPTTSLIAPLPVSDSLPSPSLPSLASSQSPEPTSSPTPSSPPPPVIIPLSSAATFIEPATTRTRHLNSAIITIVVSLLLVLLALLFIWYRRKTGPNWYKLHTHFQGWRKRRRERHFVTPGKTKRRKGTIVTFLGPPHGGMEYETRLEWGFPVPPGGKGAGVERPEIVQVRIAR